MIGTAWVWGLPLARMTRPEAADAVMGLIEAGRPSFFITANLHYAMLTAERSELRPLNDRAAFLLADGAPLVWASKRSETPLPERVAGSDLIYDLCERAAAANRSVYLLGGAEGIADEAARKLESLYPGLRVVGTACPAPADLTGEGGLRTVEAIRQAAPDLLFVAFGQPKGELWIDANLEALGVPAVVQIGATLDFITGRVQRAPRVFQKVGLEWAFRIYTDPRRLAPRYAKNAVFLFQNVARELIKGRAVGAGARRVWVVTVGDARRRCPAMTAGAAPLEGARDASSARALGNQNPPGLGLLALLREDLKTNGGTVFEQGFWAVAVHRFGNWQAGLRPGPIRALFRFLYRVLYLFVECAAGVSLPYTVRLGRRVRIWHHGGIILLAKSIGDDVQIRQNTTLGVASTERYLEVPTIGDRVDIGCGACILGGVTVSDDSKIGANAVVLIDVPAGSTAVGVPARVVRRQADDWGGK